MSSTCSTAGCDKPVRSRGLCNTHYSAARRAAMCGGTWEPRIRRGTGPIDPRWRYPTINPGPIEPVAIRDIADQLGVTPQAVSHSYQRDNTFPEPVFVVARGNNRIWAWADVERWARDTGRL